MRAVGSMDFNAGRVQCALSRMLKGNQSVRCGMIGSVHDRAQMQFALDRRQQLIEVRLAVKAAGGVVLHEVRYLQLVRPDDLMPRADFGDQSFGPVQFDLGEGRRDGRDRQSFFTQRFMRDFQHERAVEIGRAHV